MIFVTRRTAFVVAVIAVVAILVATVTGPALAGKPQDKGKPKSDFIVNVTLYMYPWAVQWEGKFNANGAIDDQGDAFYGGPLTLEGEMGSIGISIAGDTFRVEWGSGRYADLVAAGSATVSKSHGKDFRKMKISLHGTVLGRAP